MSISKSLTSSMIIGGKNMTTKRRTYTDEFKRETVRLWETTDKTAATIEAKLGITPGLLNKWKQRLKADGNVAFPGRGRLAVVDEDIPCAIGITGNQVAGPRLKGQVTAVGQYRRL
jgi:transposase-like protein